MKKNVNFFLLFSLLDIICFLFLVLDKWHSQCVYTDMPIIQATSKLVLCVRWFYVNAFSLEKKARTQVAVNFLTRT